MRHKTKKCDCCNKNSDMADTFIYEGKAYCQDCLYSLIMDMAESGNVFINFEDAEEHGILVSFSL